MSGSFIFLLTGILRPNYMVRRDVAACGDYSQEAHNDVESWQEETSTGSCLIRNDWRTPTDSLDWAVYIAKG